MKRYVIVSIILGIIAGFCGAGVSVAMLIRAIEWSEWGRVILYCGATALCVELALILIGKLKEGIRKTD